MGGDDMIKSDFHVHTEFSSDCSASMESQIEKAIGLGFDFICITDHCDMDSCLENKFLLDVGAYVNRISILKEKYKKQIKILCGLEMGLSPELREEINNYVNDYNFDFIIGSSHVVDSIDIGCNFDAFSKGKSEKQAYRRYFESILENVKVFSNYDVYGHLDFILRYGKNKSNYFEFSDYKDVFEEILKTIIRNGKGIEINTAGLRKNLGYPHPHKEILKMYKEIGGEIITVGSDAHFVEHLGYGFEDIPEILKSVGFKYYSIFENRKPKFLSL